MKKFLYIISSSGLIQLGGIISGILLARGLGPELRGQWSKIIFLPGIIANLIAFGLDFFYSRRSICNEYNRNYLLNFSLYYAFFVGLFGVFISLFLSYYIFNNHGYNSIEFYLASLSIPFALLNLLIFSLELGYNRVFFYNFDRTFFTILNCLTLYLMFTLGKFNILYITILYLFVNIVTSFLSLFLSKIEFISITNVSLTHTKELMSNVTPFGVSSVVFLLLSQISNSILTIFLSSIELGFFVVAMTVSSAHAIFGQSIGKLLINSNDKKNSIVILKVSFYTNILIGISLIILAPFIIKYVFGQNYKTSIQYSFYLIPYTIIAASSDFLDDYFKSQSYVKYGTNARIVAMIFILIFGIPIIANYGLYNYLAFILAVEIFRFLYLMYIYKSKDLGSLAELIFINRTDYEYMVSRIKF